MRLFLPGPAKGVETTDSFHRVQYAREGRFEELRTPFWARRAAASVLGDDLDRDEDLPTVLRGLTADGEWRVVTVGIPRRRGRSRKDAVRAANRIVEEIEGG